MLESLDPKRPKTYCFCSQFLSMLMEGEGFDYSRVKKWTSRLASDVFEHGKLIMPGICCTSFIYDIVFKLMRLCFCTVVFRDKNHWATLVVYMRQQKMVYYDPLQMDGKKFLAAVLNWLRHEAIDKRKLSLAELSTRAWVLEEAREDQPQQLTNTTECAVFHCITADCIADDMPVTSTMYTLRDIGEFSYRRKLGCDILRGSFHMYPTDFA